MDKKREILGFCSLALGIFVLFAVFRLPCLISFLTGCPCPGCGMTRALLHALRFDFSGAFYYHPLWVCIPVLGGVYFFAFLKDYSKIKTGVMFLFIAALLVTYVIRLFIGPEEVMAFKFQESIIYRAFMLIKKLFSTF